MEKWIFDFTCSSFSGIFGTIFGHPLDTIKCRIQSFSKEKLSMVKILSKILKEEKFVGLYKGVYAPIFNQIPLNGICFSEYYRMDETLKLFFTDMKKGLRYFLSGCWSGFICIIFLTPTELVKCIQQTESKFHIKTSSILRDIIQTNGYMGIYRGYWATFNRDVGGYGMYFTTYNLMRDFGEKKNIISMFYILIIGGVAGILAWIPFYPFDTIKTIIQVQIRRERAMTQYEAVKMVLNDSGVNGLYKGIVPCLIRAFITNAIILYSNELTRIRLHPFFYGRTLI